MTIAPEVFSFSSDNHRWKAVWKNEGDGFAGPYDKTNPYDHPLYRVSLGDAHGKVCDYCTLAVVGKVTVNDLISLSQSLFEVLDKSSDFNKSGMEKWLLTTAARLE